MRNKIRMQLKSKPLIIESTKYTPAKEAIQCSAINTKRLRALQSYQSLRVSHADRCKGSCNTSWCSVAFLCGHRNCSHSANCVRNPHSQHAVRDDGVSRLLLGNRRRLHPYMWSPRVPSNPTTSARTRICSTRGNRL